MRLIPHGLCARLRALRADDRGSTALEMAVLAPVVLALMFTALQVCLISYARSTAYTAAQQGANAARGYNSTAAAGEAKANSFLARNAGDWLTNTHVDVERTATDVTVTVRGQALSLLPGLNITVTRTAHGTVERFVP